MFHHFLIHKAYSDLVMTTEDLDTKLRCSIVINNKYKLTIICYITSDVIEHKWQASLQLHYCKTIGFNSLKLSTYYGKGIQCHSNHSLQLFELKKTLFKLLLCDNISISCNTILSHN